MAKFGELNIVAECKRERLTLLQCPPFLVTLWGVITITAIIATYLAASRYESEEIVIGSTTLVTLLSFVVGALIIRGFEKIAEADRMKSEFISIASHQLRSPLSIFKWTLDIINHDLKKNATNAIESSLTTLHASAENMIQLVNSLLSISRIETKRLILRKEPFSLEDLTKNTIETMKRFADAQKIAITFNSAPTLPQALGDKDQIGMVVYNLTDNAIRYSKPDTAITITIAKKDRMLQWSITDRGIGIPLAQQKNIFKKFFRALSGIKFQTKGTGIGLYIAKAVVDASSGTIGFTSKENVGSTFWFTIPATTDTPSPAPTPEPTSRQPLHNPTE